MAKRCNWCSPVRSTWIRWVAALCCILIAPNFSTAQFERPANSTDLETRIHIAWGGGSARKWSGQISLSQGSISDLSVLGLSADSARQINLSGDRVFLRDSSTTRYNGFEANLTSEEDATLRIRVIPDGKESLARDIEVPLRQVLENGSYSEQIDDEKNRVYVRRAAGDAIQFEFPGDHLVFRPDEAWRFTLKPNRLNLPANVQVRTSLSIVDTADGETVWTESLSNRTDADGEIPSARIQPTMPSREGVYELKVRITRPASITRVRLASKPLFQRSLQFVVVDSNRQQPSSAAARLVTEIDPTSLNWLAPRLPKIQLTPWPLTPSLRTSGPLGKSTRWQHEGNTWAELEPRGWQAFPMTIDRAGDVHELDLEYPTNVAQTLLVSILEPDEEGNLVPVSIDTGIDVKKTSAASDPVGHHRILFWPRSRNLLVLVANKRTEKTAAFGKIRVSTRRLATALPGNGQRMMLAMLDRPLFSENFSAPDAVDSGGRRNIYFDDWMTFYEGGRRLVDYLRHVGYSGATLCMSFEGSTIYPSKLVQPTPRHDRGIYSTAGFDPIRKDVAEMLFRMFDREELTLVPLIHFSSPLPELEKQLSARNSTGIELVNSRGRTWSEDQGTNRGLAPYYNPLDPRVQEAMLNVIREVVERYGHHRSFGGITVSLSPDGFTHLPDYSWGMDSNTLQRFARETAVAIPDTVPATEAARRILMTRRDEWLAWRAGELSKFYKQAMEIVRSGSDGGLATSDSHLFLATSELAESIPMQRSLRPALPKKNNYRQALLELGLDDRLLKTNGLQMPRPHLYTSTEELSSQAVNIELNQGQQVDTFFREQSDPSSIFYFQPNRVALPAFDKVSPFGGRSTVLLPHIVPAGHFQRERFIHALAVQDTRLAFDGGWMIPLGQEFEMRDVLATFQQLPARPFETVQFDESSPVIVRTLTNRDETYLYLINDTPWSIDTNLKLRLPGKCRMRSLGGRKIQPLSYENRLAIWNVQLKPFDLIAVRFSIGDVEVDGIGTSENSKAKEELQDAINDLRSRLASLRNDPILPQLKNRGFELDNLDSDIEVGPIPNWTIEDAPPTTTTVQLDSQIKRSGKQSLSIRNSGSRVSVVSDEFPAPKSGRLWVSTNIRAEKVAPSTRVRIVMEWVVDEKVFDRGFRLKNAELSSEFKNFLLPLHDLPSDTQHVRIRFELDGPGTIWVDDVEMQMCRPTEFNELMKIQADAVLHLRNNRYNECYHLLNGYWPRFVAQYVPASERLATLPQKRPVKKRPNRTMFDRTRDALWPPRLRVFDR